MKAQFLVDCSGIALFPASNIQHYQDYLKMHGGQRLIMTLEPAKKDSEKQRMYAYLFGVVVDCAIRGYTYVGYSGVDEVNAMYKLKAAFAKSYLKTPDGAEEPYLLELKNMSKDRLLKFLQDCIFFIESELGQVVPDSDEYKQMKLTGKKYNKAK